MEPRQLVGGNVKEQTIRIASIAGIVAAAVAALYNAAMGYGLLPVLMNILVAAAICPLLFPASAEVRNKVLLVPFLYICFVYTPVIWILQGGVLGAMPFVVIISAIFAAFLLERKAARILLGVFLALVAALVLYDNISQRLALVGSDLLASSLVFGAVLAAAAFFSFFAKEKLGQLAEYINRMMQTDPLTDIYNVRHILSVMNDWEKEYDHTPGNDYYVAKLGIDDLREINYEHGRNYGDEILQAIAQIMKESSHPRCLYGRYGGDEFLMLGKGLSFDEMFGACERIRRKVRERTFTDKDLNLTVSVGLEKRSRAMSKEELFETSDELMNKAKNHKEYEMSTERRRKKRRVLRNIGGK